MDAYGEYVIVEPIKETPVTSGGIVLVSESANRGTVVSIGSKVEQLQENYIVVYTRPVAEVYGKHIIHYDSILAIE